MEPGGRTPAPGELRLVQAFLNTVDITDHTDAIGTPEKLKRWLMRRSLVHETDVIGYGDLRHVVEVREALRALIDSRAGKVDERNAARILDKAASDGKLALRFEPSGSLGLVAEATGVDGALGRILVHAFRAMVHGAWPRLKVCANGTCRWAYFDASRNRSGVWCSMKSCGNRAKGRAYRERRSQPTTGKRPAPPRSGGPTPRRRSVPAHLRARCLRTEGTRIPPTARDTGVSR